MWYCEFLLTSRQKLQKDVYSNRIAVGYFFRKVELLQKIGKPISYTILLLLFLLGISVGANESIVNNLTTLGGQALLIASAGTLGSVLAAWGVYHFFFKERSRG